jgi:Tfp pilus assembly pilus retraction ATPase PilT
MRTIEKARFRENMMSTEDFKAGARRLAKHLSKKYGWHLKPSGALEAVAICKGDNDWNTLSAKGLPQTHEAPALKMEPGLVQYSGDSDRLTLELLVTSAKLANASEMYIHVEDERTNLRFRVQSEVASFAAVTPEVGQRLLATLLNDSVLDETTQPRPLYDSGTLQMDVGGKIVLSWVRRKQLTSSDEFIVIRLTKEEKRPLMKLDQWGERVLNADGGLFVITGATGSGKSTTARVIMQHAIERGMKVGHIYESSFGDERFVDATYFPYTDVKSLRQVLDSARRSDLDLVVVGDIRPIPGMALALEDAASSGITVLATMWAPSIKDGVQQLGEQAFPATDHMFNALRGLRNQMLLPGVCRRCHGDGCDLCPRRGRDGLLVVSEDAYFSSGAKVALAVDGEKWWPSMETKALGLLGAGVISKAVYEQYFGKLDGAS